MLLVSAPIARGRGSAGRISPLPRCSPPLCPHSPKQVMTHSPPWRDEGREVTLHLLEVGREYLHKVFGILPHGEFVFPPIYLFNHLFIYMIMDIYFIRWVVSPLQPPGKGLFG